MAAIDCGTNSTRLLVASLGDDGRLVTHERLMRITGLGRGVDATGQLAPDAIERTVEVLRHYAAVAAEHGVEQLRATATSAARDAANRDDFFAAAEQVLGVRPELLSGEAEAEASFVGATAELDPAQGPFLVVDIGGGSTEVVFGTHRAERSISLDVGCVRITERWLHHDPPAPDELSQALSVIAVHLDDVLREIPEATEATTFVGLAGTVSTTAAVELGLATYDRQRLHHLRLPKVAVEDVFRTLATESAADRAHNPGLEAGRVDTIVGGLCVLVALLRRLDYDELLVSESDILDGLALGLLR